MIESKLTKYASDPKMRELVITLHSALVSGLDGDVAEPALDPQYTRTVETWKAAMKIANTCLQEHDHSANELGERHNPASCIYLALEAALRRDCPQS